MIQKPANTYFRLVAQRLEEEKVLVMTQIVLDAIRA
jgi:hypothetical protein